MRCEIGNCDREATVECEWGLYEVRGEPRSEPMQHALLCSKCSDGLWKRVHGAVNSGIMHWVNKPVQNALAK